MVKQTQETGEGKEKKRHPGRVAGQVDRRMLTAAVRNVKESKQRLNEILAAYVEQNPEALTEMLILKNETEEGK